MWGRLTMFLPVLIELATGWLTGRIKNERDEKNAALISALVESAADALVIANPNKQWDDILKLVVDTISPRLPKDAEMYDITLQAKAAVLAALKEYRGQVDPLTEPWEAHDPPLPPAPSVPLGGEPPVLPEMPPA